MSERDRGDRPKKSWRELDSQRGKPRPSRDERGDSRSSGMDARASKQYRAALDALFEKGEVGKLAEKLGPGSPRIDPHDLVRGTHRGAGDSPAMSGAGSSSAGSGGSANAPPSAPASPATAQRAPAKAAAAPAPPSPPKDDAR